MSFLGLLSRPVLFAAVTLLSVNVNAGSSPAASADPVLAGFQSPPAEARPTTWWRFMDDLVTREGMLAELDYMQRVGLAGGVVSFCGSRTPLAAPVPGQQRVPMLNADWWDLIGFQGTEAAKRGLSLWYQASPGYATTGGPWITPERSMQNLIWRETSLAAGQSFNAVLPRAEVDKKWNYYRDVAVLAYPAPAADSAIPPSSIIELTDRLAPDGRLRWTPPAAGEWRLVRFGHTTTGKTVHPATPTGVGLECDKLDREATRIQFENYFAKILARRPAGSNADIQLFFDSYEAENQTWTPRFRAEFKKRRGYDPVPWILAATGRLVGDALLTRRFDNDWRATIEEMVTTEHFAELARLSRERGAKFFRAQPYNGPLNFMTAGATADIPEGEFWHVNKGYGWWTLRMIASVAHVNGKKIASAEALTASPEDLRADKHPYSTKAETDLALALGVNQFALHVLPHNPWPDRMPGMVAGPYPPLLSRAQPWAGMAGPWVEYLSRSCHLLQQGTFAADLVTVFRVGQRGFEPPVGYAADICNEELIISSMSWDGSALRLPSGMTYRLLELPSTTKDITKFSPANLPADLRNQAAPQRISLPLLRKVRELVLAGAPVVGPRPAITPGLEDYPAADQEIARLADELWGPATENTSAPSDRRVGAGRVFSGMTPAEALARLGVAPALQTIDGATFNEVPWIHRRLGADDLFFVSNQQDSARTVVASFRVNGKTPELWHADTGAITHASDWDRRDGRTEVTLRLDPRGSVFVRFRPGPAPATLPVRSTPPAVLGTVDLSTGWTARFDPSLGAPSNPVAFPTLASWTDHPSLGIRYYSGVAAYERTFNVSADLLRPGTRLVLDLGDVQNLARVTLNGVVFPALWKPPFLQDLGSALRVGDNRLVVEVANVWANRLVGDEQEPADLVWGPERIGNNRGLKLYAGRPLQAWPEWFIKNEPRPSAGRVTFTTWNFVKPDQPLLPSGLLGPVTLTSTLPVR
ncbi:MAG: hypothetical protein RLZZ50_708 [Verrucomicrobiota bacterium]